MGVTDVMHVSNDLGRIIRWIVIAAFFFICLAAWCISSIVMVASRQGTLTVDHMSMIFILLFASATSYRSAQTDAKFSTWEGVDCWTRLDSSLRATGSIHQHLLYSTTNHLFSTYIRFNLLHLPIC